MPDNLSPARKRVFWAILIFSVFLLPLLAWEAALRVIGAGVSDDPYLQLGPTYPFFVKRNIDGRQYYRVANRRLYRERNTAFPVEKDPGTFRVFCVGESASAGWPHPSHEIYSAYLEEALARAYPQHKIEVINVSAHSFPAYRVRQVLEKVVELEPDLIVIWSGNNEFLERRIYSASGGQGRWLDPFIEVANRSVLFRTLRVNPLVREWFPENTTPPEDDPYLWWSLLEKLPLALRTNSEQFERVKQHYAFSIESMVKAARAERVPVILITVPVNLRDWRPNASYQIQGDDLARWQEHYARGRADLLRSDLDSAISELEVAKSLAPLHAETYFELARALEAKGRFAEALENFSRARDLDYNPSRAISDFNAIVRGIASRYDDAELVDADAAFRSASAPRAPGFDLFLDYVHPTKQGNLLMARIIFDTIVKHRFVEDTPVEQGFSHRPQPYRCEQQGRLYIPAGRCGSDAAPYDDTTDFPMQVLLIRMFAMMNQNEGVAAKLKYLSETPGAMESLSDYHASFVEDATKVYPKLVELERRALLGDAVDPDLKSAREDLLKFQRKYYKGYEEFKRELGTPTFPRN